MPETGWGEPDGQQIVTTNRFFKAGPYGDALILFMKG